MTRSFFSARRAPVVAAIMAGETPEELIAQTRGAEFEGADGIAITLSELKPEFREQKALERVIRAVKLPFMFFYYRHDRWQAVPADEDRQKVLLSAAEAGAAIIDVMGDLYDPSPRENTHNAAAIAQQMQLIEKIHALGSQVVMSSHLQEPLLAEEVLQQLQDFARRGPDVLKIVTTINSEEEFTEAVRTTMLLRRELDKPFIHLCNGSFGRIHRFLGPTLGVSICFAVHRYDLRYPMIQPTVQAMKTVLQNYRWHIDDLP